MEDNLFDQMNEWMEDNPSDQMNWIILQAIIRLSGICAGGGHS